MEQAKELFFPHPPEILYHYCSNTSFLEIIKQGQLWLTDINKMNDSAEERWAANLVRKLHRELRKEDGASKWFYKYYPRKYESKRMTARKFIACFSENGDTLSQWRAYADNGTGMAIGFYTDKMNVSLGYPDLSFAHDVKRFMKVCYSNKEQETLVRRVLNYDISTGYQEDFLTPSFLAGLSIALKNEGFSEEKEWRMVYAPAFLKQNLNDTDSECFFRVSPRGISPYLKHSFPQYALAHILIGPINETTIGDVKFLRVLLKE